MLILLSNRMNAQSLPPEVQDMVDSLNNWISNEMAAKGMVNADELAKRSERIRIFQDSLNRAGGLQSRQETIRKENVLSARRITRTLMAGSALTVPPKCEWLIKAVYVRADIGGYRLKVTSLPFKESYLSGEIIAAPAFSAESSLLSSESTSAEYDFEVTEITYE